MTKNNPVLTPEELKECFRLKEERGWSYQAIANKFGLSRTAIRGYFKKFRF